MLLHGEAGPLLSSICLNPHKKRRSSKDSVGWAYAFAPHPLLRCRQYQEKKITRAGFLSYRGGGMDLQVISRDGEPEYAVLPWAQYQALLQAAGVSEPQISVPAAQSADATASASADFPSFDQLGVLRQAKGIEAAKLARAVGISPSYLELIENGMRQPDAAIRRSLAWELGVPGWRGEP